MIKSLTITFALLLVGTSPSLAQEEVTRRARGYEPLMIEAAIKHRVDPRLLWTVAWLETGFQPQTISPKGAQGMMQFMPATAKRYKLRNPFDPAQSIDAAARYLRDLQAIFGPRLDLMLAAYNAGEGAVEAFRNGRRLVLSDGKVINPKAIRSEIPPYRETLNYVTNGVRMFAELSEARYFSAPHLIPLHIVNAKQPIMITVDLEESLPEEVIDLKKGSVYAVEETPSRNPTRPKKFTTRSVYFR